jgi:F-type H+-transporting ATPase subunit a
VTGVRNYTRHHFKPLYLFPVRLAEIGIKTVTLSLRLFGVLFASAILVEVVNDVLPPPLTVIPLALWTAFDVAMAIIQAYIFAVLAITYYNLAVDSVAGHNVQSRDHEAREPVAGVRTLIGAAS